MPSLEFVKNFLRAYKMLWRANKVDLGLPVAYRMYEQVRKIPRYLTRVTIEPKRHSPLSEI